MILIGEKLNSSIPSTGAAFEKNDFDYITDLICRQSEAGAEYLDLNAAVCTADSGGTEYDMLVKLIKLVKENCNCNIMLDSPNADVLVRAAETVSDRKLILNSVTASERIDTVGPAAAKLNAGIVVLPISEAGIPASANERLEFAVKAVEKLNSYGVNDSQIYIDAIVEPVSSDEDGIKGATTLETLKLLKTQLAESHPDIKTICGLSNVSFGLPKRALINSTFLAMAVSAGLDSAILDVNSPAIADTLHALSALNGEDEFCVDYIGYMRSKDKK